MVHFQKWLPEVAFTFVTNKEEWNHLIPTRKSDSVKQVSWNSIISIPFTNILNAIHLESFQRSNGSLRLSTR